MGFRALPILAALVVCPGLARAGDDPGVDRPEVDPGLDGERALPTAVWVDKSELVPEAAARADISNVLFINRCVGGCTVMPGRNDARTNHSSIIDEPHTLSEFAYDDATFDAVVDCVEELYGPYNVVVTTDDPGMEMFHHEAILAGSPGELGLNPNIGGIAAANCEPLNNVISYSFANRTGGDVEEMCWTVAQESAHSFGLPDHVFDCHDPMTYIPGCERKYFRNKSYPCGETEARTCMCGGTTQNSHLELLNAFGPGTAPPPPAVAIVAPSVDAEVLDEFGVYIESSDPRLVDRVELWFNGTKVAERPGNDFPNPSPDYVFTAPAWPDGYIDVEVKAYNDIGSEGIASVRVLKGAPCTSADSCLQAQECIEGACTYPPASQALGDSCEVDQQCVEGRCAAKGDERVCASACNPDVQGSCLEGFYCLDSGACWPEETEGGCCSVAGGQGEGQRLPWVALGLFAAAILVLRRRA